MPMIMTDLIRTQTGQWNKSQSAKTVESILNRNLSRELGMSLRADTVHVHAGNSNFLPPAPSTLATVASRSKSVPLKLQVTSMVEHSGLSPSSLLRDTDPSQDDYLLLTRGRDGPPSLTQEQAEFLAAPAEIPPLPSLGLEGRNIWTKGALSAPSAGIWRNGKGFPEIDPDSSQKLPPPPLEDQISKYESPFVTEDDSVNDICDGTQALKLTANQIFEICFERCLTQGKVDSAENDFIENDTQPEESASLCSVSSSEACTEDLPFISALNVYSMRRREQRRAQRKSNGVDEPVESSQESTSSSSVLGASPTVEIAEVGEVSFSSANSDPERLADDTPLFTIRSKKEPIKIVDPKTLQRRDKAKSPQDIAKDVDFLKKGLRVLGNGVELTKDAFNLFKTVGMDNIILDQTSEWLSTMQDFSMKYDSCFVRNQEAFKDLAIRNSFFENLGQMMAYKKKMDNAILGWTNFAISMFPTELKSSDDESIKEAKSKTSPKVLHAHSNACLNLTHDLCSLTDDNLLKFRTSLAMLIASLGECKDWLIKAPFYAKVKSFRNTDLKHLETLTVPVLKIAPPTEPSKESKTQSYLRQIAEDQSTSDLALNKQHANRVVVSENERPAEGDESKLHSDDVRNDLAYDNVRPNPHNSYQAQQPTWYGTDYAQHHIAYGLHAPDNPIDYAQNNSPSQALGYRPTLVQHPMSADGYSYHQTHMQTSFHQDNSVKLQHNRAASRGRQTGRSVGHSRQSSATSLRQPYHNSPSGQPQYQTYQGSVSTNEYSFSQDNGDSQYTAYTPTHLQPQQQSPVDRTQVWHMTQNGSPDLNSYEIGRQQYLRATTTPEQIIGSGDFIHQAHQQPGSLPSSPLIAPPSAMLLHHHSVLSDHFASGAPTQMYAQGASAAAGYVAYAPTAWEYQVMQKQHHGQLPQLVQQGQIPSQARGQKFGALTYPYGHPSSSFR